MRLALCLLALCVTSGCLVVRLPQSEPRAIVIRNLSGGNVESVELSEAPRSGIQARRVLMVSHIPRNVTQRVGRADNARPLPPHAQVSWTDAQGHRFRQDIALKRILADSTGRPGNVLIVDLFPDGRVGVYRTDPDAE